MKREPDFRRFILTAVGIALSVIPPAVATLCYFPLWQHDSGKLLSGSALVLLLCASIPLWRLIRNALRSPAAWMLWLISFLLFFCLSRIADDVTVIAFTGTVGNLVGAVFLKLAGKGKADEKPV